MKKSTRNIVIIAIIVLLIFGIAVALYGHFHTEPINANTTNNILDDANTGLENLLNDILDENNSENEEKEENRELNNSNNNTTNQNTQTSNKAANTTQTSSKNDNVVENQTTPGEKKAIELAKAEWEKEWGSLDDVSFYNVMIQGDGKYIVSVNDSTTTKVICRYVVDAITGVVEKQ